jgi:hypothetical protein
MNEDKEKSEEQDSVVIEQERNDFVSKDEFDNLKSDMTKSFSQIIELIKAKPEPEKTVAQKVEEKKVDEASADISGQNPRYEAKVKEILGDKVERVFLSYPKGGGTLFTIVIKNEFSNAAKDYLTMYKVDHRTVNLERDEFRGEDGVERWAKLVLANLNKPR